MSRAASSRRTHGASASAPSSQATKGSLCAHLAGKPRFLLTVLRNEPVPVSSRWASARRVQRKGVGRQLVGPIEQRRELVVFPASCSCVAASRAGPLSASAQPNSMASDSASKSSPMASASHSSMLSRSEPWASSGSHWSRWPSMSAMASLGGLRPHPGVPAGCGLPRNRRPDPAWRGRGLVVRARVVGDLRHAAQLGQPGACCAPGRRRTSRWCGWPAAPGAPADASPARRCAPARRAPVPSCGARAWARAWAPGRAAACSARARAFPRRPCA